MSDVAEDVEPGVLPTEPAPTCGERITLTLAGLPPFKDMKFSIRDRKHPKHAAFVRLRTEATKTMAGRRWYDGAIGMKFTLRATALDRRLTDYLGGIMDTLDGSHGFTFTYLPIVYQDDCQVADTEARFIEDTDIGYTVEIAFL